MIYKENNIDKYLSHVREYEKLGYIEEAITLCEHIISAFPESKDEILQEKWMIKFRNNNKLSALQDLLEIYLDKNDNTIYDTILELYYKDNKENYNQCYKNNINKLKKYKKLDVQENNIPVIPIWYDDKVAVYANYKTKSFNFINKMDIDIDIDIDSNSIVMLINYIWLAEIFEIEQKTEIKEKFMDRNLPFYLGYDEEFWKIFLCLVDINTLISNERIVILLGTDNYNKYLKGEGIILPNITLGYNIGKYDKILLEIIKQNKIETKENKEKVISYYNKNKDNIIKAIKNKKPKILFYTSRFTTALQYHTRDCKAVAEKMGLETRLLIEKDGIHRINSRDIIKNLIEFKPDIVFCINHFRFEFVEFPPEIIWICWLQDYLPHIINEETPLKCGPNDIIMNHFITSTKINELGYNKCKIINAPIPSNSHIYKPYEINKEEKEKYSCDICMVCHASDVYNYITKVLNKIDATQRQRKIIYSLYKNYADYALEEGNILDNEEDIKKYIINTFKVFNIIPSEEIVSYFLEDIKIAFNDRIYRQLIANTLISKGYTNLKLWGDGWLKEKKYAPYAMGSAKNGEILSKILQCSKIVLGNNHLATGASRAWETMLSGSFYMSNYVPEDTDTVNIRMLIKENEDFVMFYNMEDMLNKIDYYLNHESERLRMTKIGREKALSIMTFDKLMKKVIEETSILIE